MNINTKIFTANGEELASYALFHDMIKVMKAADGVEPAGACCGRNTKQIINLFISNKQKYFDVMKNINTRLIKPLRKGIVYISPMKKMLNYELMTDNEILLCVKKGYLSEKIFDWTEYSNVQKPVAEETPTEKPIAEEPPIAEPIAEEKPTQKPITAESVEVETPVVESVAEEPPVVEPIAEETPVEKPKRSSKRGSK